MDFTLKTYIRLLQTIRTGGYSFQTFQEFVVNPANKAVVIRHDSDIWPINDLRMATIENGLGIKASYYFRIPSTFDVTVIKKIRDLAHEIGYHYEDLATFHGDNDLAIKSFGRNLEKLKQIYNVKTVSMHGRPLSRWDSRDLWKIFKLSDFGIIGEPYLDIDYNVVLYLTENGNRWNGYKSNIRDTVKSNFNYNIKTTFELMDSFRDFKLPDQIILNIHPARWNDNLLIWAYRYFLQNLKNIAKRGLNEIIKR